MYYTAVDITIEIDEVSKEIRKTHKYNSIIHIHCRACQIALEILSLLKNRFADGAFARYRTLWELTIYSKFIHTQCEDVAKAYWEQAKMENPPKKALLAKGANCFKRNKKAQGGNITFDDIRKNCIISDDVTKSWDSFNLISSKMVHASPISTFGRLGCEKTAEHSALVVSHSPEGLWYPTRCSLLFLLQSTSVFVNMALDKEAYEKYYSNSQKHIVELMVKADKIQDRLEEYKNIVDSLLLLFETHLLKNN